MQREHLRGDLHIFREIDSVVSRLDVVLNLVFTGAGSTKTLGEVIGQTFGDLLPEQLQAIAKKMKHFVYEDHEAATRRPSPYQNCHQENVVILVTIYIICRVFALSLSHFVRPTALRFGGPRLPLG